MRQSISVRTNLDPPQPDGQGRAFTLALLAHLLLILALAWGLHWKKDVQDMSVEAELWAATAQTAAPKAAQPPPPPPVVPPRPEPAPQPKPAPPVDDSKARQAAELALEQQKKREEAQRQAEIQKRKDEQQRKAEEEKRKQAQRQEERRAQQAKAEADRKAAEQKAKAAEQKAQAVRQANIIRMTALATSDQSDMVNPAPGQGRTPGGSAKRDAGPSAEYGARVRARVFPNITYLDPNSIGGNPAAEVQVRALPDGTIVDRHLSKPSGVPSWDDAVLRAIDKTQVLPRDVDGRVPSPITIVFTPHQ